MRSVPARKHAACALLCVEGLVAIMVALQLEWIPLSGALAAASLLNVAPAALAAVAFAVVAGRVPEGQRRVMRGMALGCALWAAGAIPVVAFVVAGGQAGETTAWTQTLYLLAYPAWFWALWALRHQALPGARGRGMHAAALEVASFGLVAVAVCGALWSTRMTAGTNIAYLVPVAVDLVLLAGVFAVARPGLAARGSGYGRLVGAFGALAAADALSSFLLGHHMFALIVIPLALYTLTFALLGAAATQGLEMRTVSTADERITIVVVLVGLAVAGPAAAHAPLPVSVATWIAAAVIAFRAVAILGRFQGADQDRLTGLYNRDAFCRHATEMIERATPKTPIGMVVVDMNGFGRWNQEQGYKVGDTLLVGVAERLVALSPGGVWGRVGPDRFSWAGPVCNHDALRSRAAELAGLAAVEEVGMTARVGALLCPADAATMENASAAIDEAMAAARTAPDGVCLFADTLLRVHGRPASFPASFRARKERIRDIMDDESALYPVFQPIVEMGDLRISGYEGLSRIHTKPDQGPDLWIAEAHAVDLGLEFEAECVERIIGRRRLVPTGRYISVNVGPRLLETGQVPDLVPAGNLDWLVIELTEHGEVSDYKVISERVDELRARGARLAIDDVGAGHSSLRHVMTLRPDFAKLDRSLVTGVDTSASKRALIRSMLSFTEEADCRLVAEGIETAAELDALRELGVELGQGYLFHRPVSTPVLEVAAVGPVHTSPATRPGTTPPRLGMATS